MRASILTSPRRAQAIKADLAALLAGQAAGGEVDSVTSQAIEDRGGLWAIRQYATKGTHMTQLTEDNQGIGGVTTRADTEPPGAELGDLIGVVREGEDEVKRRRPDG